MAGQQIDGDFIHVNGPTVLSIGYPSGSLFALGLSEDGVDIELVEHSHPVMTDAAGPQVPAAFLDAGEEAIIRARLAVYDRAVLRTIRKRGNSNTEGVAGDRGVVLPLFRLCCDSQFDEPWRFLACKLEGAQRTRISTTNTVWALTFRAIQPVGAAFSATGTVLYDRTIA
jgi:hypothetical protein